MAKVEYTVVENFPVTKLSQLNPDAQRIITNILLETRRRRKRAEREAQQTKDTPYPQLITQAGDQQAPEGGMAREA